MERTKHMYTLPLVLLTECKDFPCKNVSFRGLSFALTSIRQTSDKDTKKWERTIAFDFYSEF